MTCIEAKEVLRGAVTVAHGYCMVRRMRNYSTTNKMAHRHIWEQCFGEIPEGLQVLHRCDNPPCVNPEHLFLGTRSDNMRDMHEKGRGRAKLTRADAEEIRRLSKAGATRRELAEEFGVSKITIRDIVKRRTWL